YVPWILRQTTAVFHCGRLGREYFQRYGVPLCRLYPFPYEPDYGLFSRMVTDDRVKTCRHWGLAPGRRRLIFAGRMVAAKRPDLLWAAFESVADARPEWDLLMVGDGPLRDELEKYNGGSFGGRIHWLGFINDPADLASLYAVCDAFVLPSN